MGAGRALPGRALPASSLPALALLLNALIWGTSWWPFRRLQAAGLHPLWTTAIVFTLAVIVIAGARPRALRELAATPSLWILAAAAGATNASFNWAIVIGDVVRVVLLFYLMPLWTVLLARFVLGERLSAAAGLRIGLGLAGAAIVLWPHGGGATAAAGSAADALGLVGGFSFALNNVMLRRQAASSEAGRALAMFSGGAVVAGSLAVALAATGRIGMPPAPDAGWLPLLLVVVLLFLGGNLCLQYGAARLPANVTAVVMLTEVVFASISALAWGDGVVIDARLLLGAGFIVAGALLAAFAPETAGDAIPAALPS